MTTLVTIGCSHTAGSMIDGRSGTSWFNKQHSFGGLLAKKYGINHYNLGVPGGSNQYIYRACVRFINNFMHDHDDYIFLIGWTSTNRIELRYPENSNYVHQLIGDFLDTKYVPFTAGTDIKLWHTNELKELDKLCPLLLYENQLESDWAVYAYTLQNIFKNNNLRYYMFNTCHELPINDDNQDIVNALDTNHYHEPINFDSCMLYWALNRGFEKTACWHLKADGHAAWAEHLDDNMKKLKLFDNLSHSNKNEKFDGVKIGSKIIEYNDIKVILDKYKLESRLFLDNVYDEVYILFPEKETEQSMKIKINIVNKDLTRRFGQGVKISKWDNQFNQMDDMFIMEHFRKLNHT